MTKLGPYCCKRRFFGKMTKGTFAFSKRPSESESWDIRLQHFDPNWAQVVKRGFLGKTEQFYLRQSIVSHHVKMFQQKTLWQIMRYKFKSFWAKLGPNSPFALKEDFLQKLTNTTILYLLCPVMLQCLKKYLE